MKKEDYIKDLKEIREIMDRSSRFISLSGLSGIVVGVIALVGAYLSYHIIYVNNQLAYDKIILSITAQLHLLLIASGTLISSLLAGIYLTSMKARKDNQKLWNRQSRRLLISLSIPLIIGGLVCLILFSKGYIGLIAPMTLIFYGLALVNASHLTLPELKTLGISECALGVLAFYFIGYGLLFWGVGFGLLHIVYGVAMYKKYGS